MVGAGKIGRRETGTQYPGKLFLGLGAMCFVANHLAVVFGNGIVPEALVLGCLMMPLGGWFLLASSSFEAAVDWVERPTRRQIVFGLLTFALAIGLAEAVAWFAYGQHLWG